MDITLIFPHQLFKTHPANKKARVVYLVEEYLFFNQYNFNKKKLLLHRASMKFYADHLTDQGIDVKYIEAIDILSDVRQLIAHLAEQNVSHIHYADVADDWLRKRLTNKCRELNIGLTEY